MQDLGIDIKSMNIERVDQLRYLRDAVRERGLTADEAMLAVAEQSFISAAKTGGIYDVTRWRRWYEERGLQPPDPNKPRK